MGSFTGYRYRDKRQPHTPLVDVVEFIHVVVRIERLIVQGEQGRVREVQPGICSENEKMEQYIFGKIKTSYHSGLSPIAHRCAPRDSTVPTSYVDLDTSFAGYDPTSHLTMGLRLSYGSSAQASGTYGFLVDVGTASGAPWYRRIPVRSSRSELVPLQPSAGLVRIQ